MKEWQPRPSHNHLIIIYMKLHLFTVSGTCMQSDIMRANYYYYDIALSRVAKAYTIIIIIIIR